MLIEEGLELLSEEEARRLLAYGEIGRIGVTISALPAIFPVNYRYIGDAILFRTAPGSKLSAAARGAIVAFEVDEYNAASRGGWSVLAVGPAEVVHDDDPIVGDLDDGPDPYAGGERKALVRITPTFISGRRIVHSPPLL